MCSGISPWTDGNSLAARHYFGNCARIYPQYLVSADLINMYYSVLATKMQTKKLTYTFQSGLPNGMKAGASPMVETLSFRLLSWGS